jgi:hypothetical protein
MNRYRTDSGSSFCLALPVPVAPVDHDLPPAAPYTTLWDIKEFGKGPLRNSVRVTAGISLYISLPKRRSGSEQQLFALCFPQLSDVFRRSKAKDLLLVYTAAPAGP